MEYEKTQNTCDLVSGIFDFIKNIAGNTCISCRETFIPNKKNDELCDQCRYNNGKFCLACGSVVTFLYDNACCSKCFEKYKKPCNRCGEYCIYQANSNLCSNCRFYRQ
jgi:hypothetical protein